ncbi:hypothetical protein HYPSUDRAFT_905400 [Hypholoma sublateritium FD-334 SS-4]|uniref:Uncharacterized protein n=1 Tax=Hypholoma sublateritium (strain FD-334 SS-4) TaxID=945553 RepID=A0A0D2PG90_HYPSF|nr:hypothetical protein HYPSUDRAFT_905400 [Hypholoma sublateritium FD-334 SS-4]
MILTHRLTWLIMSPCHHVTSRRVGRRAAGLRVKHMWSQSGGGGNRGVYAPFSASRAVQFTAKVVNFDIFPAKHDGVGTTY